MITKQRFRAVALAAAAASVVVVLPAAPAWAGTLGITVTPLAARPGATVTVSGSAFDPNTVLDIFFDTQDVQLAVTDGNGNLSGQSVTVPASAAPGTHWITAREPGGKGAQKAIRVAASWSQAGFSARHQGANPFENQLSPSNVAGLNEDWVAPTDGFLDRSVPAVAGNVGAHGVVYVGQGSGSNRLIAFDAQTGARLWQSSNAGPFSSPAVSGNRVFVTEPRAGRLDVFSTTCPTPTCAPLAQSAAGYAINGAPTISGGVVYIADATYGLDAFRASCTGTCVPVWTGDANGDIGGWPSAFAVGPAVSASGRVFVMVHGAAGPYSGYLLAAYSPTGCSSGSCAPTWYASGFSSADSDQLAVANGVVFAAGSGGVSEYRAGGCPTSPCDAFSLVYTGGNFEPAISRGVLYTMMQAPGAPFSLTAVDITTGSTLWTAPVYGANDESVPAVANGVVYVNANDSVDSGELWAFPTTGCSGGCTPIWHAVVSATGYSSSPVIANGTVYDASGDGSLYAYDLNPPPGTARPRMSQLRPSSR